MVDIRCRHEGDRCDFRPARCRHDAGCLAGDSLELVNLSARVGDQRRQGMPVQKFAPMTKNFAIFDCDAHVTEPPWLWERAKDWLTKDELEALKNTIWFDRESDQIIANGKAGAGIGSVQRPSWDAGHRQCGFCGGAWPEA